MSTLETIQEPVTNPWAFDAAESVPVETLNDDPASVASDESADADNSEPIREINMNPRYFDASQKGHFEISERHLAAFTSAVEGFYRSLSSDSGYRYLPYSVISFRYPSAMSRFLSRLREMRPAVPDTGLADEEPLVYFDFSRNSAAVWDSQWPSTELEDSLREMRISSQVTINHRFLIAFKKEQEERHFLSDCKTLGVKFGCSRSVTPKFLLEPSKPVDPSTVKGMSFNEFYGEWTARRTYDGFLFDLGSFRDQERAAKACAMFDHLMSLVPAAKE